MQYDPLLLPAVRRAGTLYWISVAGVTGGITSLLSFTDLGLAALLVALVAMPIYQLIGGVVALVVAAATAPSAPARDAGTRTIGKLILWGFAVGILPVVAFCVYAGMK